MSLTVHWPPPTRLIPDAAQSIKAVLTRGTVTLGTKILTRPAEGPWTTTVTFDNLEAGEVLLTATAFPGSDATGVAQATGSAPASIVAGQTTAVTVTMNSTIASITLTPTNPTIQIGGTVPLTVTAKDAGGNVVLITPGKLQFNSSNTSAATVSVAGIVTGVSPGASDITVTDMESGVPSAPDTVTVESNPLDDPRFITMTPDGQFLYVVSTGTKSVTQFRINSNGTLTLLSPASVGGPPGPLVFKIEANTQSNAPFVYVTNPDSDVISQFHYDAGGKLSPLTPPTVATSPGDQPAGLAIHPNGKFLYTADPVHSGQTNPRISLFRINTDGTLASLGPDVLVNGFTVNRLAITPDGQFLYANSFPGRPASGQALRAFRINTDGTLTFVGEFGGQGVSIFELVVDPTGHFLYTASASVGGVNVRSYQVGADGSLTEFGTAPSAGPSAPSSIDITPNGKFVYVVGSDDKLYLYGVNTDGSLASLTPASVQVGHFPVDGRVSPNGQFIYVANGGSDSISAFRINADGTLTPL